MKTMRARVLFFPLIACVTVLGYARLSPAQLRTDFARQRQQMVSEYIEKEGIHSPRVLEAMRRTPRHEFVPADVRSKAYTDAAWPIGYKQTISPPFIVAFMTETLDPKPTDRVLEIGTGSGYQAAVLSLLVKEVYTIEIVEPLGRAAEKRLKRHHYNNVHVKVGDGYLGWPAHAPFDKIIVTCSPEHIPQPLIEQLKEGGRIVIPLGERYHQDMYLVEKKEGKLVRQHLRPTLFVPMTGRSEAEREVKPDPAHPQLVNGNFEQRDSDGRATGWHYQRQMTIVEDNVSQGRYCARFDNENPGRISQALQGMAVDGRVISTLRFTLNVRFENVHDGPHPEDRANLQVQFFDGNRNPLNDEIGARWIGSSDWHRVASRIAVPANAREAIIRIGLNGATGRLYVDDIRLSIDRR